MGQVAEQIIDIPLPLLSLLSDDVGENAKQGDTFVIDDVESNAGSDEVLEIEEVEDGPKTEIVFTLNAIPGAPKDLVVEDEEEVEEPEEEQSEIEEEVDSWVWEKSHGTSKFINWLKEMIEKVPAHSGTDTTGIERAMSYFERLNTEISKAMRKDYKNEIDAAKAEEARSMIEDGLKRLRDRLERLHEKKFKKIKKKAGITKTADTSFTGGMSVNIPYFISMIARICINATVSSGKDMSDIFSKLVDKYKLDNREQLQIVQLIKDMGYPLTIDRMKLEKDSFDPSDNDGEFAANYLA